MDHELFHHRGEAGEGDDGKPTAMTYRMTSQSITGRVFGLPGEMQDPLMTEAALAAYEIPALQHDARMIRVSPAGQRESAAIARPT